MESFDALAEKAVEELQEKTKILNTSMKKPIWYYRLKYSSFYAMKRSRFKLSFEVNNFNHLNDLGDFWHNPPIVFLWLGKYQLTWDLTLPSIVRYQINKSRGGN